MSFFKDFKADFAQAVNELIPDSDEMTTEYDDEDMVNTFDAEPQTEVESKKSRKKSKFFASFTQEAEETAGDDEDIEIAPEDLIDDIDDIEREPKDRDEDRTGAFEEAAEDSPEQEMAGPDEIGISEDEEAQMSFDFLANAMNVTNDGQDGETPVETETFEKADEIDESYFAVDDKQVSDEAEGSDRDASKSRETSEDDIAEDGESGADVSSAVSEADTDLSPADSEAELDTAMAFGESETDTASETGETESLNDTNTDNTQGAAQEAEDCYVDTFTQVSKGSAEDAGETVKDTEKGEAMKEDTKMIEAEEEKIVSEEQAAEYDESTTYITKSTKLTGDIETDGSIDIIGEVVGNVDCKGKLVAGGVIRGNVNANEVYANAARIEGDINCEGSAKIGVGSVIIGKVEASSAVVAGAVNGDIDVHGPVIVDSTAVIMGNIKSRSVQINNGAVIEGFCSQCYSEIDVKSFFA